MFVQISRCPTTFRESRGVDRGVPPMKTRIPESGLQKADRIARDAHVDDGASRAIDKNASLFDIIVTY